MIAGILGGGATRLFTERTQAYRTQLATSSAARWLVLGLPFLFYALFVWRKGLIKLGGILSYHVVFQAKRYQGSVSSSVVRDFRGAMSGRADKGLILTTGSFTREAKKEASRDGAIPIDLIDGNEFAERLKELNLGVSIEMVEEVKINTDWFTRL